MSWQPLEGVAILDFSALLPAPFATVMLADLGADVVKVEPPAGDFTRSMPNPSMFRMVNRNKRSVVLDLKRPESAATVAALARWADVVVEGSRPGVAERLGIGYEALSRLNPRIVYCSVSGFGQTGPDRLTPGHDGNYLAAAGALALSGHWGEQPRRSGLPVADLAGGMLAAIAILSALRERERTGRGTYLDVSLTEAAMLMASVRQGLDADRPSFEHLWPPNDLFETADGRRIALGIVEDHFWRHFVDAVGADAPDLAADEWSTDPGRRADGDRVQRRMREIMRRQDAAEWMRRFSAHDVPAQVVLSPKEASEREQIRVRGMVMERDGERHIPFPVMANGARGAALRSNAPALGQHTEEVLAELEGTE